MRWWLCNFAVISLFVIAVVVFLQLLDYVTTTIYFSDKNVDSNLISWNRVVLLHGKLLQGRADWSCRIWSVRWLIHLSVSVSRIQDLRARGKPHSAKLSPRSCQSGCQVGKKVVLSAKRRLRLLLHLFCSFHNKLFCPAGIPMASLWRLTVTVCSRNGSQRYTWLLCWKKWVLTWRCLKSDSFFLCTNLAPLFQSGKLVTKMFQKIQQLIDDKEALVFVLIDEVQSVSGNIKWTRNVFSLVFYKLKHLKASRHMFRFYWRKHVLGLTT